METSRVRNSSTGATSSSSARGAAMHTHSVQMSDAGVVLKPSSKSFSAGTCAFSAAPCSQASIMTQRRTRRAGAVPSAAER